jgi:hypothetical protein
MSGDDQFLSRWSRRKRAAKQARQAPKADSAATHPPASSGAVEAPAASAPRREEPVKRAPPFDPATLPAIESITAATDIRPFLAPGVPAELTRAALRRVWTSDPAIRDFVGIAENAWDFNAPSSIPGFGAIEMTAQLRDEITRMVGRSLPGTETETAGRPPEPLRNAELLDNPSPQETLAVESALDTAASAGSEPAQSASLVQRNKADVAPQAGPLDGEQQPASGQRRHGRALPK